MSQSIPIISIVIPVFNDRHFLKDLLNRLISSVNEKIEVVIIDSSEDSEDFNISQFVTKNNQISFIYLRIPPSYAGKSLNLGVRKSSGKFIGFLDTKTFPAEDWPFSNIKKINDKNLDILFGLTVYKAESKYQKILKATSYGSVGHESVPGTVVSRKSFNKNKGFVDETERVSRSGWSVPMNRVVFREVYGLGCDVSADG